MDDFADDIPKLILWVHIDITVAQWVNHGMDCSQEQTMREDAYLLWSYTCKRQLMFLIKGRGSVLWRKYTL